MLGVARLAGVQGAKLTGQLIPLAHPLGLTFVDVHAGVDVEQGLVELVSEVRTIGRTGVEMEAMTACAVAALTVYDMVKGIERGVEIEQVVLLEKRAGAATGAATMSATRSDDARGDHYGQHLQGSRRGGGRERTEDSPRLPNSWARRSQVGI